MDFKRLLDDMTAALRANAGRITLPKAPKWAEGDKLTEVYDELPALLRGGSVYYSCVVQANKVLFDERIDADSLVSVATILYNHNRSQNSISNPEYLAPFAHYLFNCKKKEPSEVQDWLAEAVNVIRGETDRSRVIITADGDEDYPMNLTMQSLLVFRAHLPKFRLGGAVVPIVAAPGRFSNAFILPCSFWDREFKDYWIESL